MPNRMAVSIDDDCSRVDPDVEGCLLRALSSLALEALSDQQHGLLTERLTNPYTARPFIGAINRAIIKSKG